ncbi:MAG TPA: ABC transporter permease [Candidatus Limnocylindrales bacterium]|nr:ABC transporter permease [Candidatus Limnocylindrales bacterium]
MYRPSDADQTGEGPFVLLRLSRVVVTRARSDLAVVGAAWLLLLCATSVLAATVLYADTVATGGLREAVAAEDVTTRNVDVRIAIDPDRLAAVDAIVRPTLGAALGSVGGAVVRIVRSDPLVPAGSGEGSATDLAVAASLEGLPEHARLTAGRWATAGADPIEATLSEPAARALGIGLGDRSSFTDIRAPSVGASFVVVGLWTPVDPNDPYWLGDPLERAGSQAGATGTTTRGPFVVADADLGAGISRGLSAEWRGLVPVAALSPGNARQLSSDVAGLRTRLGAQLPATAQPTVTTGLPRLLDSLTAAISASRSSILLLALQFGALAVYAVVLVSGLLLERRRAETALLRSRGATTGHLVRMALVEALLLALPVVVLAPLIAVGIVALVSRLGPAPVPTLVPTAGTVVAPAVVAVVAGLVWLAALTLPTVASAAAEAGVRASLARPIARTLGQRLGLDLVLVVVAGIGLWQLRLYGAPLTRTAGGTLVADPLLVAAPALTLVAGGIVAIRILPRLAELGERGLGRARGLVASLGSRQLARRPLRYTRSALLLVLAVALGTFAAAYAATWTRSQADQAAYRAVASVRVVANDYPTTPPWASASLVAGAPGVAAAVPVSLETVASGRSLREVRLAAVDAARLGAVIGSDSRAQRDDTDLRALAAARPDVGLPLPGRPARIRLTIDAALVPVESPLNPVDTAAFGTSEAIGASAVVADGSGRLSRIALGSFRLAGGRQSVATPLSVDAGGTVATATPPLRLEALELTIDPPTEVATIGSFAIDGLAVSDEASGERWVDARLDPAASGWSWRRDDDRGSETVATPADAPGRIEIANSRPISSTFEGAPTVFRLSVVEPREDALAAIANPALLAGAGLAIGDGLTLDAGGHPLDVRIVGSATLFAPLDPTAPFLVVDGPTLDLDRFAALGDVPRIDEWWLATTDDGQAAAGALEAPPFAAKQVIVRASLERSLLTDPVSLGVIGALALGAVAALVFAAIGFLVNTTVATAERSGELAVLRALGVSRRQLLGWLLAESAVLLVVGLIGGVALGILLAQVVLPATALTASGAPAVPAPIVVIPLEALVPIEAGAITLLVAALVIATRQVPPLHVGGAIRAGEE